MLNTINSDLIRGHIDTIILKSLFSGDRYGYDICREIELSSSGRYELKQPTLYSCLKRLESQGFVSSYWGEKSKGSRRKYYTLTEMGRNLFLKNQTEWEYSRTVIDRLISDRKFDLSQTDATDDNRNIDDEIALTVDTVTEIPPVEFDKAPEVFEGESDDESEIAAAEADSINAEPTINANDLEITDANESESTKNIGEVDDIIVDDIIKNELDCVEPESAPDIATAEDTVVEEQTADEMPLSYFASLKTADAFAEPQPADRFEAFNDELAALNEQENLQAEKQRILDTETKAESTAPSYNFFDFDFIKSSKAEASASKPTFSVDRPMENDDFTQYNAENLPKPIVRSRSFARQEQDYKTIVNKLLRNLSTSEPEPQAEKHEPADAHVEPDDAQTSDTATNAQFTEKEYSTNFVFADSEDPPHYTYNFRVDDEKKAKQNDSLFFDIPVNEFTDTTTRVRAHTKGIARQYNSQFYIYGNKLRFVNMLCIGTLMLLETILMIIIFGNLGFGSFANNAGIYFIALMLPFVLMVVSYVIYKLQPTKKQRAQFHLLNNLIFCGIVFLSCAIFIFSLNLALDMRITNYHEYLVRMLVPIVLSSNFVIGALTYYALYKSKKFAV